MIPLDKETFEAYMERLLEPYGFHSLRHLFASYCAEAGVPQATVLSILGADSEIVSKFYTHVGKPFLSYSFDID